MKALHDEFDSLWIEAKDDGDVPGSEMDGWFYSNRSAVFFALRDYAARHKVKEATATVLKEARDAIDVAAKAFAGKFE